MHGVPLPGVWLAALLVISAGLCLWRFDSFQVRTYMDDARSEINTVHLYVPLYLGITVLWPWRGDRFLCGVLPFLVGHLLLGAAAAAHLRQSIDASEFAASLVFADNEALIEVFRVHGDCVSVGSRVVPAMTTKTPPAHVRRHRMLPLGAARHG